MPPNLTTGPSTPVLDAFNRANGGLGSNWSTPVISGDQACGIVSNAAQAQGSQGQMSSSYWSAKTFDFTAGAVECWADIAWDPNVSLVGYMYATGYHYRFTSDTTSNNRLRLTVCKAGTDTIVHQTDGLSIAGGGQLWMWVEPTPGGSGLDIYCMYRTGTSGPWTQAWPVYTDTTLVRTSGYIGMRLYYSTSGLASAFDNFRGGILSVSNTVVAPPASVTMRSVAPVPQVSDSVVAPPATVSAQSVAPVVAIPRTVVSPPSVVTAQSVAPSVSGTALVTSPPATFFGSGAGPGLTVSPLVIPGPATWTATAAPPGLGQQIITTVGVFTATASAGTGNLLATTPALWTAAIATPAPTVAMVAPVGVFTVSSVTPVVLQGIFMMTPVGLFTASAIAPFVSIVQTILAPPTFWTAGVVAPTLVKSFFPTVGLTTFFTLAPAPTVVSLPTPATTTYSSMSPTLFIGFGDLLISPPATFSAGSVAPIVSVMMTPSAVMATFSGLAPSFSVVTQIGPAITTYTSSAPSFISGSGLSLAIPPAVFMAASVGPSTSVYIVAQNAGLETFSVVAPSLLTVVPIVAALATFSSNAPSFVSGSGQSLATPAARFTATSGSLATSVFVTVPFGSFSASSVSPVLGNTIFMPVAIWNASSVAPTLIRSPLVVTPFSTMTLRSNAPGILTGIGPTAAAFTAASTTPIPGNLQTAPVPVFTAVVPTLQIIRTIFPSTIQTTFTSAASVRMDVQLPAGVWTANASSPQLAAQVSAPAGKFTASTMTLSMDVEKVVFADVARWTAATPSTAVSIRLFSPVPVWIGSPQNPRIGRGSIAVPAIASFFGLGPNLQQESMAALYTYVPGDIVESNAWPLWQH